MTRGSRTQRRLLPTGEFWPAGGEALGDHSYPGPSSVPREAPWPQREVAAQVHCTSTLAKNFRVPRIAERHPRASRAVHPTAPDVSMVIPGTRPLENLDMGQK